MSRRPIRKPKPRRALPDERRSAKGTIAGGVASLLASSLLAAGSIMADSPAQAAEIGQASAVSLTSTIAEEALRNVAEGSMAHVINDAVKHVEAEEAAHRAAVPVAHGAYNLGAGWGDRGSWSRYHTGVDLTAPVGTPVYAVASGVVGQSDAGGWAGVHAVIHHEDGSSLYAHMSSMTVKPGDHVTAGQVIGAVGNTGRSFGAHLHFEYYPNGAQTSDPYTAGDPSTWLEAKGVHL